jgi:hypothetical protein
MFFSAAPKGDQDGVRIAEDAANGCDGDKAWERIEVAEPGEIGHAAIVTGFAGPEKTKTATKTREFNASGSKSYPHYSAKSRY